MLGRNCEIYVSWCLSQPRRILIFCGSSGADLNFTKADLLEERWRCLWWGYGEERLWLKTEQDPCGHFSGGKKPQGLWGHSADIRNGYISSTSLIPVAKWVEMDTWRLRLQWRESLAFAAVSIGARQGGREASREADCGSGNLAWLKLCHFDQLTKSR